MYSIPCITRTRNLQMVIVRYLSLSTWQHHQNHYKNRIGLPSDKRTNRWKIHHSLHGKAMDFHSYLFTRGYSTQVYPQKDPTTRWKNPWKSTIYKLSHFQGFCSYQFPISEDSSSSAGAAFPRAHVIHSAAQSEDMPRSILGCAVLWSDSEVFARATCLG